MRIKEFTYNLPEELIAQTPCESRDGSRMMVVNRMLGSVECRSFCEIPFFFKEGDVLVVNDSKVIPARLIGKKPTGGSIEILLLEKKSEDTSSCQSWEVLLRPAKRVSIGTNLVFKDNSHAVVTERISDKKWILTFNTQNEFNVFLEQHGRAPLPPYIKRGKVTTSDYHDKDIKRYQTVYANNPGSIAAPTAGLHFSYNIINVLNNKGVEVAPVTLHVGYGTFLPIETELIKDHVMEYENFEIQENSAKKINEARRVIAVGTTSTRVLESIADQSGRIKPHAGRTNLFISPGYQFKRVDALLTNFHLPESSLFLLVCSLAGKELMQKAYKIAVEEKFRFYSYGDCMLIL